MSILAKMTYRLLEVLDGERIKHVRIVPYPIAERLKIRCLQWI